MSQEKGFSLSSPNIIVVVLLVIIVAVVIWQFPSLGEDVEEGQDVDVEGLIGEPEESKFSNPDIVESSAELDLEVLPHTGVLDTADYAIVEFTDFLCPFCEQHGRDTFPKISEEFLNEQAVYIFSDMPMMDPQASMDLSVAGMCIYHNSDINELLDYRAMAYDINNPNEENILEVVKELEVDTAKFKDCYQDQEYSDALENNLDVGSDAGVTGVPGFLIGELSEEGVVEGYRLSGALPYEDFEEVLNYLMD